MTTSPKVNSFKPRGRPLEDLVEVYLTFEGLEAIRLADLEGLSQQDAADRMDITRQTFGRILAKARKTLTEAVVMGYGLHIRDGAPVRDCRLGEKYAPCGNDAHPGRIAKEPSGARKVAVSSEGPDLDDRITPRFGRAAGFFIVDPETMEGEYLDNASSLALAHGAGIQAAEMVARAGAGVVLTGSVGPKAFAVLNAAGIRIFYDRTLNTVREALEDYKQGGARQADHPERRGHGR